MHTPNSLVPATKAALDELPPTYELYGEFQFAYEHFNRELWEGKLPHCLITLQRKAGAYGYFCAERFERIDGRKSDEIALNPSVFARRPFIEVASVLVHEMVHLWQQHNGNPGRGRYHNKEWAREMKRVGLFPSSTGEPGGRETGDHMSHYIIVGGLFWFAARKLEETPLAISWGDAPARWRLREGVEGNDEGASGTRTKFTCPACNCNAWGKASLKLLCRVCNRTMLAPGEVEDMPADGADLPAGQLLLPFQRTLEVSP